jgi:hypothetical protein
MRGVALLPEEFTGTEERLRVLEFPSDDRVPLVELEREITVGLDPLCVVWEELGSMIGVGKLRHTGIHNGFRGRADGDGLLEFSASAGRGVRSSPIIDRFYLRASDPSYFRRKAFDVVLFTLENLARDEHGEVRVFDVEFLDLGIEPLLDSLPDSERPRLENVASRDAVVIDHLGFDEDLQYG